MGVSWKLKGIRFEIEMENGIMDITVPDGIYSLVSEYKELSGNKRISFPICFEKNRPG